MGSFNKGKEDLMNLQTITVTNAIGVTMMIVLQTSSYLIRQRRLPSDRVFTAMILITSAGCATETISFMADGRTFPGAHTISVITCTLLYALNVTLSYMWCIYVDLRLYKQESRLKKYYTRLAIPTIILLIALIPNIKFGYLFSFDSNNTYIRQPLSYLYYISVFMYIGFSVCVRYKYYKNSAKAKFFPIWLFVAPLIIGTTSQLVFYGTSLAWISAAVGLLGIHMGLQNELAYIVRNPFVAMKDVNPLAYPWCSGYLYFNNMLDLSGEPLCALGTRKLRAFCCSRYPEIPQTSILVRDGMAIPATFTDYRKAMSFFDDARQFIMCVFKNVEAQVEIAHRMGEKPFLNDDELYGTVIRQSRLLFQTGKIQDLSDQQKMRLAHRLKAYYQCSNAQVARVLYLPIQTVNDLFPLAAKP